MQSMPSSCDGPDLLSDDTILPWLPSAVVIEGAALSCGAVERCPAASALKQFLNAGLPPTGVVQWRWRVASDRQLRGTVPPALVPPYRSQERC